VHPCLRLEGTRNPKELKGRMPPRGKGFVFEREEKGKDEQIHATGRKKRREKGTSRVLKGGKAGNDKGGNSQPQTAGERLQAWSRVLAIEGDGAGGGKVLACRSPAA